MECAIDEKKAAVDAAETALAQAQDTLTQAQESDNSTSQAVSADLSNIREQIGAGADSDTLLSIVQQAVDDYTAREQQSDILTAAQQAADAAQSKLEQAQKEFDSAVETYNKNVEETNTKITELTESLDNLKSDYEQAARDAKTQKAELKNEYDTAVVEGKYAGSTYEATVSELESAVESAQNTLDTLKEEQTALIALENGVVTADEDGTIAAVPYEAGNTLQPGTAFALYCDTQTIMISVEVSQEKVAQVHVGEEVSVMISGNREGAVTGTVSSIASSATTGESVSNVTYAVIISIDNPDGKLGSGSSATVIFQGEQEEKQNEKEKVAVILSLGAAALLMIGGISVYAHQFSDSAESETVYKETTAGYGTLTVGITESGSVTIGSISQDMDEDISISSDSGSGQTSGTQASGTSTGNSSVALEVEEVYISVGQQVKAGDALLKLTDDSIEKYRKN